MAELFPAQIDGTASERELVVTRTVNGPARIVFAAWTKPELLERRRLAVILAIYALIYLLIIADIVLKPL